MSEKFIDELVEYQKSHQKEISCRFSDDKRFRVYKYTKMVHFNGRWNQYSRVCRGLVLDSENNIVSYPFDKFFNLERELEADKFYDFEEVYALRKYNGFLAIVSKYKDELVVNCAGSFNPEYVGYIKQFIDEERWLRFMDERYTYMFECVPNDCDHVTKEKIGLTLVGFREKKIGSEIHHNYNELVYVANDLGCMVADTYQVELSKLKEMANEIDYEGFVIYSMDGKRMAKLKGKKFLYKRFLAYLSSKNLEKLKVDESLDEEYRGMVQYILDNKDAWMEMNHQERVLKIKEML